MKSRCQPTSDLIDTHPLGGARRAGIDNSFYERATTAKPERTAARVDADSPNQRHACSVRHQHLKPRKLRKFRKNPQLPTQYMKKWPSLWAMTMSCNVPATNLSSEAKIWSLRSSNTQRNDDASTDLHYAHDATPDLKPSQMKSSQMKPHPETSHDFICVRTQWQDRTCGRYFRF